MFQLYLLNIPLNFSFFFSDQFSVGDIVFAKYSREPYWPAQVSVIFNIEIPF